MCRNCTKQWHPLHQLILDLKALRPTCVVKMFTSNKLGSNWQINYFQDLKWENDWLDWRSTSCSESECFWLDLDLTNYSNKRTAGIYESRFNAQWQFVELAEWRQVRSHRSWVWRPNLAENSVHNSARRCWPQCPSCCVTFVCPQCVKGKKS